MSKKRLGSMTLDEVVYECDRRDYCELCPFDKLAICPILGLKIGLQNDYDPNLDTEIELDSD